MAPVPEEPDDDNVLVFDQLVAVGLAEAVMLLRGPREGHLDVKGGGGLIGRVRRDRCVNVADPRSGGRHGVARQPARRRRGMAIGATGRGNR